MKLEVYQDASKGWRWRAVDTNGRIISDGAESYSSKQAVIRGMVNVVGEFRGVEHYRDPDGSKVSLNMDKSGEESEDRQG